MPKEEQPQSISPAEWEVMKLLWKHGNMAARDVCAALPKELNWANKTVKTLLSRLVAKGAVTYDQIGNSYLYRPVADELTLTRQEVRSLFNRVARGALSPVLAHFIEQANLSDDEIEHLRQALKDKKSQSPPDGGASP